MTRLITTKQEVELIRDGGKILARIMDKLESMVKPGMTTGELEDMTCQMMAEAGARPAFKGYKAYPKAQPFPTALCASINHEIVHGPAYPSRPLQSGDIIGLDIGMQYPAEKGLYTDMARTVACGRIDKKVKTLLEVTKGALAAGISQARPGNDLNDIGTAIENYVKPYGFGIVRDLVGHGVGLDVHEEPQVPNYSFLGSDEFDNVVLEEGMVIAIEPMVNLGTWRIKTGRDNMTFETQDKSLSAHFEHTIAVTENGHEILTLS